MHRLFHAFAERYDLHTPPSHYQHDHQLVLDLAREHGPHCRILDIGCGTGVLLQKAHAAGFEVHGLDASEAMIATARARVPPEFVRVQRMQALEDVARYDLAVSMSWSIHYCSGEGELADVLRRIRRALVPGGRLLLQVAHGPNHHGEWIEDFETGPSGAPDDVSLRFRFRRDASVPGRLIADYAYKCGSLRESMEESHVLEVADADAVARLMRAVGFTDVDVWDSWQQTPLATSGSAFIASSVPR